MSTSHITSSAVTIDTIELTGRIATIIETARKRVKTVIDTEMVRAYWEIGREIVVDEQKGEKRAGYGKALLARVSNELTAQYGEGFDARNLRFMRQFYQTYQNWNAVRSELSWTHFRLIMRHDDSQKRSFYEIESVNSNWSTRELERQMNSMLYERLSLSRDVDDVKTLAREGQILATPSDMVKDPYVLEFLGLPQDGRLLEKDLENALISKLQQFLLELGKGFSFVARQRRITLDGRHFFIDLIFYNYILKCFVLIDLKTGELTHQDIGQMQMYVNYFTRELVNEGDSPPIGILLCDTKSEAVVRYTLPEGSTQIFASRYKLYLPTEEELAAELVRERQAIELEHG